MFRGVWPALVSPLDTNGSVNVGAVEALVEDLIACDIGGLYVCGGTGEGVLLPEDERRALTEASLRAADGRVPVMVHIGDIEQAVALRLAEHANGIGCAAISAVPPFYYGYSFAAVREHYERLSAVSEVPLYLYHIPGATGVDLTTDQLLELCELDGVGGLKYSSHDLFGLSRLLAGRDPQRTNLLSGPDELFLPCRALGADGAIGTTYNVMPRTYVDIAAAFDGGDIDSARRLQFGANAVIDVLIRYGVIPATKALLNDMGYGVGEPKPPLSALAGDQVEALVRDLGAVGWQGLVKRRSLYGAGPRGRLA